MQRSQIMKNGALEKIRTSDLPLRRRLLYPAELRRHLYIIVSLRDKIKIKLPIICERLSTNTNIGSEG